jgi:hypothetical protein
LKNWLVLLWLFFGSAAAQSGWRIEYPAHLQAHAQEVLHLWQAAQTLQLETGGQPLPQHLCLETEPCLGRRIEPEQTAATITGLRSLVAWVLEQAARPAPIWFWSALVLRQASVLPDAKAEARRRAWALAGQFPSLQDINLSQSAMPFAARAEFGAGFAGYLLERFGLPKLKQVLRFYYANWTLSDAFFEAVGQRLEDLFGHWREATVDDAKRFTSQLETTGLAVGTAMLRPAPPMLAWTAPNQFIAAQNAGLLAGQLPNQLQPLAKLPFLPSRLSVAANGAVVYVRPRALGGISGEVFVFSGREVQLTENANATDAASDGDCVVYIRAGSSLWRWCAGVSTRLFDAPKGWRLLTLSAQAGQVALGVLRGTWFDLALWQAGKLELLTSDTAQDQNPIWLDGQTLVYTSNRLGSAQLWRIGLGEDHTEQISAAIGGAFSPSPMGAGRVSFYSFVGQQSELRWLEVGRGLVVPLEPSQPPVPPTSQPLTPSLLPDFGVAFSSGLGVQANANVDGFSYRVAVGYDFFGAGFGADVQIRFAPVQGWRLTVVGNLNQQAYGIVARATWFGTGEVAAERVGITISPFVTFENGVLTGWFDLVLGNGSHDTWGYTTQNWQLSARLNTRVQYTLGITLTDALAGGFVELGVGIAGGAWSGGLGIRGTYPLGWRFGDAVLALERLTVLFSGRVSAREQGLSLALVLDGVLNYTTLFSLGLEFGYSSRQAFVLGLIYRL